jgi:hypothetical protein
VFEFDSNSSLLLEVVDDNESLLLDLFSHDLDLDIYIVLECNNDLMSLNFDSFSFTSNPKVVFELKIKDELDVVCVNIVNLDQISMFNFINSGDIDVQLSFFFISEEGDVVYCDSFDFNFEFKLKSKSDLTKDSSIIKFELFNDDGSFSGDSNSDFFKNDMEMKFNISALNIEPIFPLYYIQSTDIELHFHVVLEEIRVRITRETTIIIE